jgi:tripartite ATP-independent transporter DctM subunit
MITTTVALTLLVLIFIGMPIAFATAFAGALGLWMLAGWDTVFGVLKTTPYRVSSEYLLSTVPMFILMAEFLAHGRVVRLLFDFAHRWIGHVRGGLAQAAVVANVGFAALSGSSTAAAAAMARISVPEMRRYGYDDRLSLATVAIAGTLSIMIPPSLALILYGILTETSIGKLFVAGIVPGLMTAFAYMATIAVWTRLRPGIAPMAERASWAERWRSVVPIWSAALLVVFVATAIYSGAISASEAGAIGALGALVVSATQGGLTRAGFAGALAATVRSTTMIFAILIGASIFGVFLAMTQAPQTLAGAVGALEVAPWQVLVVLILIYVILGCFIDQLAIIILTLPLTFPLVMNLGYDPIWFGIIITKTIEIGMVTPPMGLNIFVTTGSVPGARMQDCFVGIAPFLVAEVIVIALLISIPDLALYLPSLM